MGASLAFYRPVLSIIHAYEHKTFHTKQDRFKYTMRTIQGSLMISSLINIILGFSQLRGKFTRLFTPVTIVPVVSVVGLGLFLRGFPLLANCVEIGLPMLILLVLSQPYLKQIVPRGQRMLERYALLVCIGIIWALAAILTVSGAYKNASEQTKLSCCTDRSYLLSTAPWIRVPYPFQWGSPVLSPTHIFGMMGAALVSSVESTGTFYAASRLAGVTAPPAHVLSRSIGLHGIGTLIGGIFGSVTGTTASALPTVTPVLGVSLFLGMSTSQYFGLNTTGDGHGPVRTGSRWFNVIVNVVFSSALRVAMVVGAILDHAPDARNARNEKGSRGGSHSREVKATLGTMSSMAIHALYRSVFRPDSFVE
ncbi:hypothetical protein SAY87_004904 [Trapa incisa]|uniref:Nucleobase-ascorbate transporter 3 n=1 Tax=Trapa incisa TaxID=236973 RepID=A0AAN7JPW8_9MYRT|nr:hypothetical protein SAY87_004904 [Trapa incisa]